MDRKYEVFISSTAEDMKEIRERLIRTTLENKHIPCAMEIFGGTGESTVPYIEERILEADIFVILVGAHYGSTVKGKEQSFTELEYRLATENRKPTLVFLLDEDEFKAEREKLSFDDPDRKHDDDLRELRDLVQQDPEGFDRIVDFFTLDDIGGLADKYGKALQSAVDGLEDQGGWVRGELYDELRTRTAELRTRTALVKRVSENPFFKRFVERLNAFDVLSDRCVVKAPHLKRAIADCFIDQYLGQIIESGIRNLFFESGSSIAFLSEAFIDQLQHDWMREVERDLHIQTNNILTYLDFVLSNEHILIELYPYGPPESRYGATFGPLTRVPRLAYPREPRLLTPGAREAVEKICTHFVNLYRERGIILMAASGIELSRESQFPGPHVGSYYNKLFKRAILASACPIVIFLDETKIPRGFTIGDCYSVCDEEMSWSSVCRNNPLAIAVAASGQEKANELERLLIEMNLTNIDRKHHGATIHTLIASNDKFQDSLSLKRGES